MLKNVHSPLLQKIVTWAISIIYVLIFIFSIIVIFQQPLESYLIKSYRPAISSKIIQKNKNSNHKKNVTYDWQDTKSTNLMKLVQSRINQSDINTLGLVTQPGAKVSSTIVEGVSDVALNYGAGTLRDDQQMGKDNYVITAHHVPEKNWALFSGIYFYAQPKQYVYITDLNHVYQYQIKSVKFVKATQVDIVNKDRYKYGYDGTKKNVPMITLISCDATGNNRITEYGSLVKTYDINDKDIPKEAINGFKKSADFNW